MENQFSIDQRGYLLGYFGLTKYCNGIISTQKIIKPHKCQFHPKKTPKEPTFHITILPIGFFSFLFFFVPFSILSFSSILYSSFLTIIPHLLIFFLLKSQIFSSHDSFNFHYLHLICVHILVYFNPHPDIVLKSTHLRKHFYLPPSQLFFESISD